MAGRPNILILHVDQLRQDCLGAYGNTQISTPNIDELASESTVHSNHYTCYPVCVPARYSFITGLPYNKIYDLSNLESNGRLSFNFATFPKELKDSGYHTSAIGKMHYEPPYHDVGFQEMVLCEQIGIGRWVDDYHRELQSRGLLNSNCLEDQNWEFRQYADEEYWDSFGAKVNVLDEKDASTGWIGAKALEAIDGWDESNPEMMMVSFVNPHHPFDPPLPWSDMYDPEQLDMLPGWMDHGLLRDSFQAPGWMENRRLTTKKYRKILAYYYALISEVDHHVGKIVARLKKKGLYEDTMIVFTTDHGDYMGYHHMILKGNHMYEPLMKIPLIIKYPGNPTARIENRSLTINTDIARTILSVAGMETPAQMRETVDLSSGSDAGHDFVVSFEKLGDRAMVRHGKYKLQTDRNLLNEDAFHWGSIVAPRGEMLFDLDADPLEMNNIATEHADVVSQMKGLLFEFQGGQYFRGNFIANEFNAPIIDSQNAQEATRERVETGINHFLGAFKNERGIT